MHNCDGVLMLSPLSVMGRVRRHAKVTSAALAFCIGICFGGARAIAGDACERPSANAEIGAILADLNRIVTSPEKLESEGDPTVGRVIIGLGSINSRLAVAVREKSISTHSFEDCARNALAIGLYRVLARSAEGDFNYDYGRQYLTFEILFGIKGPFSSYIKVAPNTLWRGSGKEPQELRWGGADRSAENAVANLTAVCLVRPNEFQSSMLSLGFDRDDVLGLQRSSDPRISVQGRWLVESCMKGEG